jgi:predicted AAA+ superfamily ATPase
MVFIGGPRQCGKTTMSLSLLKGEYSGAYFNWDLLADRNKILGGKWTDQEVLLIFDEIHKYKKWRNLIKGYYDTQKENHKFLVTGSARLDYYRRGGDSLLGRYHYWRLHPFSLFEKDLKLSRTEIYRRLLTLGGFPEPFLDNSEREARRWRESRIARVIREDLRDLESVQEIPLMELFYQNLRSKVGSTLAVSSLAQEVQISPVTAKKWLRIFEQMYLIFTISGYDRHLTRAVHKPIKVYFYDTGEVIGDESQRLENLVATHLQKRLNFIEDYEGYRTRLHYAKDKNQREVDFLVMIDGKIKELIEVKLNDQEISSNLIKFAEILKPDKAIQIVKFTEKSWSKNKLVLTDPIKHFHSLGVNS